MQVQPQLCDPSPCGELLEVFSPLGHRAAQSGPALILNPSQCIEHKYYLLCLRSAIDFILEKNAGIFKYRKQSHCLSSCGSRFSPAWHVPSRSCLVPSSGVHGCAVSVPMGIISPRCSPHGEVSSPGLLRLAAQSPPDSSSTHCLRIVWLTAGFEHRVWLRIKAIFPLSLQSSTDISFTRPIAPC